MKKIAYIFAAIILLFILAACSKAPATTQVQNPVTTQAPGGTPAIPAATSTPKSVPSDVAIMPDAYDLEVSSALNISYKVKAQIKDIVTFYQEQLPLGGWDQINNPDSVVGSMAQIARTKTNGDRINLALQYNMVGEFTVITIYLTRVAP